MPGANRNGAATRNPAPTSNGKPAGPYAIVRRYSEIKARPVPWLWPRRIALGTLTLLVGRAGCGKSFLVSDIAARISTGSPFIDGTPCERGTAILMNFEDSPEYSTAARLAAHDADPDRIVDLTEIGLANGTRRQVRPKDVNLIEAAIGRMGDVRLLVIDPIGDYLGGSPDSNNDGEVRAVLGPLADLAERNMIAIVCVLHHRKSFAATADGMALGSVGFVGKARSVLHLLDDPDDPKGMRKYLAAGKSNLGPKGATLAFAIGGEPARVLWERDAATISADDIVARFHERANAAKGTGKAERAKAWLAETLAAGPLPSREIFERATGLGHSRRTIERASEGGWIEKAPAEFGKEWLWTLASESPPDRDPNETLAETGGDWSGDEF